MVSQWPQAVRGEQDPFDRIASDLSQADCIYVEFLHIVESAVFNDVDSMPGVAQFDNDGRYRIELPNDEFVCDGRLSYAYSIPNNQIVIERLGAGQTAGAHDLLFLAHLKEYYKVTPVISGRGYRLVKTLSKQSSLPDSMNAYLTGEPARLDRFEYLDINEDRNQLIITSLTTEHPCPDSLFVPSWPDSVDRVKL